MVGCLHIQQLIDNLDRDLQYAIKVEVKMDLDIVSNYDEVRDAIKDKVIFIFFFDFSSSISMNLYLHFFNFHFFVYIIIVSFYILFSQSLLLRTNCFSCHRSLVWCL